MRLGVAMKLSSGQWDVKKQVMRDFWEGWLKVSWELGCIPFSPFTALSILQRKHGGWSPEAILGHEVTVRMKTCFTRTENQNIRRGLGPWCYMELACLPQIVHLQSLLHKEVTFLCLCVKSFSCVCLFATPWTVAHQAPLSMGFSRQEYWSTVVIPFSRGLSLPGIKPQSPTLQADSLPCEPPGKPSCYFSGFCYSSSMQNKTWQNFALKNHWWPPNPNEATSSLLGQAPKSEVKLHFQSYLPTSFLHAVYNPAKLNGCESQGAWPLPRAFKRIIEH